MKLKKVLGLLLALTVACSVLVSCGDDEDSSSKKSKKNDSAVSAAADSDEDSDESDVKIDASEEDDSDDESSDKEDDSKDESSEDDSKDSSKDDKDSSKDESKSDVSENPALDADIDHLEGKWECEYMEINGTKMKEFLGIPVAAMMQLEFKEGGKGTIAERSSGGEADKMEFTWEVNGSKCTVTANNQPVDFEFKDNRLILEATAEGQSEKVVLKKVKEFTEFDFDALKDSLGQLLGDMSDLDLDNFDFGGND